MAAVALSRIDPGTFGGLIDVQIDGDLRAIYRNHSHLQSLAPHTSYPILAVLQSALKRAEPEPGQWYLLPARRSARQQRGARDRRSRFKAATRVCARTLPRRSSRSLRRRWRGLPHRCSTPTGRPRCCESAPSAGISIPPMRWARSRTSSRILVSRWLRALATFALGELGAASRPPQASMSMVKSSARRSRSQTSAGRGGRAPWHCSVRWPRSPAPVACRRLLRQRG